MEFSLFPGWSSPKVQMRFSLPNHGSSRGYRGLSYSTAKQLNVHFPKDLYVSGRKGCGQAWAVSECLTYVSLSKISQVTFYRSCLCVFLHPAGNTKSCLEHELSCPICSVFCLSPFIAMATPCCPWGNAPASDGWGRWWSSTALAVPAHPAPAGGGSPWMDPMCFE